MNPAAINCFFVTDLHGDKTQYEKLFELIKIEKPKALFLGGDLMPSALMSFEHIVENNFIAEYLAVNFNKLKETLGNDYPEVFLILGNDDPMIEVEHLWEYDQGGLWHYMHNRSFQFMEFRIWGYSYIPPSPILLKDWEKYDISCFVDPGCVSPEEGFRSIPVEPNEIKYATIKKDLAKLTEGKDLSKAVFLFHSPPYKCALDRAALDNKFIDHVPLDVHVGSIAIKELIEDKQPYLTLHGHIHESSRLTGAWRDKFGKTESFSASHDGKELALVRFDLNDLKSATREHL